MMKCSYCKKGVKENYNYCPYCGKDPLDEIFVDIITNEKEANRIMGCSKEYIKKQLLGYMKRIDYLEGKEFYDGIIEDYKKQHKVNKE